MTRHRHHHQRSWTCVIFHLIWQTTTITTSSRYWLSFHAAVASTQWMSNIESRSMCKYITHILCVWCYPSSMYGHTGWYYFRYVNTKGNTEHTTIYISVNFRRGWISLLFNIYFGSKLKCLRNYSWFSGTGIRFFSYSSYAAIGWLSLSVSLI